MAFINRGGFLMGKKGLAFSRKCCCKSVNCYCYQHFLYYGLQVLERRVVCYAAPEWDGSKLVFPDGQPCVPPGSRCTVIFAGNIVKNCSCPGSGSNGEGWSWAIIEGTSSTSCTTISPPP